MNTFQTLELNNNCYKITRSKKFIKEKDFKSSTIDKVFNFAYNMTLGNVGQHRTHRSNGIKDRKQYEIFYDTFQGKLAECAVANFLSPINPNIKLDFTEKKLGYWDQGDIDIFGKSIAIKSTKHFGNLLLLECADWNNNAEYIPNIQFSKSTFDYFIMVRIKTSFVKQDLKKEWQDSNIYTNLLKVLKEKNWCYEISGYITNEDFKSIIKNEMIIRQNYYINSFKTKIDANNYYVQLGDLRSPSELLKELKLLKENMNANL